MDRLDLLAVMAPTAKLTPDHIINCLRLARTNVLVWRGKVQEGLGMGMF